MFLCNLREYADDGGQEQLWICPEFGSKAIWRIEVVDFPAFIIIDDKGNDFFKELNLG